MENTLDNVAPAGSEVQPRIVCAANRLGSTVLLGIRHWDEHMHNQVDGRIEPPYIGWEQGFIDQFGNFLSRTEAWKVAEAAGQIIRRCGGDSTNGGTLYSENLY